MDELPVELLAQIIEYCDFDTRKKLRCVTKTLHNQTTPLVFEQVCVAWFKHSRAKFAAIASSHLAKHVRKLVVFSDTLPRFRQAQWKESIDMRPEFCHWREQRAPKYPDEPRNAGTVEADTSVYARARKDYDGIPRQQLAEYEIKAGWKAYKRHFRDQRVSHKDCGEAMKFQSAFCKLPNLSEVVVATALHNDHNVNAWPFWKRFCRETFVGPDNWKNDYHPRDRVLTFELIEHATLCLYEAMARRHALGLSPVRKLRVQHTMATESTLDGHWRQGPRQPVDLLRDWHLQKPHRLWLAHPFTHLTEVSMRFDANECLESLNISEQINQLLIGAKELRRLVLVLENVELNDVPYQDEESDEDYNEQSIKGLDEHSDDESAENSDEISDDSSDDSSEDESDDEIEDESTGASNQHYTGELYTGELRLFHADSIIWPKIEHLALSIAVSGKKFARFLKLHSATLRSLELHQTVVFDAPKLLKEIPKVLHLKRVLIKDVFHDGPTLPHHEQSNKPLYPRKCMFVGPWHGFRCSIRAGYEGVLAGTVTAHA